MVHALSLSIAGNPEMSLALINLFLGGKTFALREFFPSSGADIRKFQLGGIGDESNYSRRKLSIDIVFHRLSTAVEKTD
jgi:hypothetical protein